MRNINQVVVSGRLTRDISYKPYGEYGIYSFDLAINQSVKLKTGEWEENTTFVKVTFFATASTAKILSILSKGDPVLIEGSLRSEKWIDAAGNKKERLNIIGKNIYKISLPKNYQPDMPSQRENYGQETKENICPEDAIAPQKEEDEEVPF